MKKLNYIILVLLSIIFLGCSEPHDIQVFGKIKGIVMDKVREEPLSGVSISISPLGKSVTTNNNGEFEFLELEPQEYTISISKNQYNSETKSILVEPGITTQADFSIMTGNGAIELSKHLLDFGRSNNTLVFDIENIGKNQLEYIIDASDYDWLTVSPQKGIIESTRIKSIIVKIDRTKIDENISITLPISSNAGSDGIDINVIGDINSPLLILPKEILDFGKTENEILFEVKNLGKSILEFKIDKNKDWIEFSSDIYKVGINGSVVVAARIDRTLITKDENASALITSNGGSKELDIIVKYVQKLAIISVSKTELDFGEELTQLSFDVENIGDDVLNYSISIEDENWIIVSPSEAVVKENKIQTVSVSVDRDKLKTDTQYTLIISSNVGSKEILVKVTKPIKVGELKVSTSKLDFNEDLDELSFTISNTGTADFDFTLYGNYPWLSVYPVTETVQSSSSKVVTIYIDREKIIGAESGVVTVKATNGQQHTIDISAFEPINYGSVVNCDDDVLLTIKEVKTLNGDLYVKFNLTNYGDDFDGDYNGGTLCFGDVSLTGAFRSSNAIDDIGNSYYLKKTSGQRMSVEMDNEVAYGEWSDKYKRIELPGNGASVNGEIIVYDIDDNATKMSSITFGTFIYAGGDHDLSHDRIILKDIPIIR